MPPASSEYHLPRSSSLYRVSFDSQPRNSEREYPQAGTCVRQSHIRDTLSAMCPRVLQRLISIGSVDGKPKPTLQGVFARSISSISDKRSQRKERSNKDDTAALLFRRHRLACDLPLCQQQLENSYRSHPPVQSTQIPSMSHQVPGR